jgi:membrane protein YqaA with SNARE-associated domain
MQVRPHIPIWLQRLIALMGSGGLFVVAFLDSSVLSFPFVTDALVIELCVDKPVRMPLYVARAALGSLAGCIWIYLLARKGGAAYFHHRHARGADRARRWVEHNAFLSVFIPSILPPPLPFKIFVLAEGGFQVPPKTFILAILLGRGLRYTLEGLLAVRYGDAVLLFLRKHGVALLLAMLAVMAVLYALNRLFHHEPARDSNSPQ